MFFDWILWRNLFDSAALVAGSAAAGYAAFAAAKAVLLRLARRTSSPWDERFIESLAPAGRALFPLIGVRLALPGARLAPPAEVEAFLRRRGSVGAVTVTDLAEEFDLSIEAARRVARLRAARLSG